MGLTIIKKNTFFKDLIFKIWLWDAKFKLERIREHITKNENILDIGTGPGSVFLLMNEEGYNVSTIDVEDQTFSEEIQPKLYDGQKLPYANGSFDTALLLTVLHHTQNPKDVLLEAMRVSKRIIIIEDIYSNTLQKYLTFAADSIVNLEFRGHPHTNKNDSGWLKLFDELGLKLLARRYDRFSILFKQATYILEK
ncbi:MAG: methyltransferase domain-containing protein [Thermodesulfobacteriota bacterium]